jgi:transposase
MRMVRMATWTDESVLQRPPSEDRGCHPAGHAQGRSGSRTFGVGISTVKRYAAKAQRGEPLEPGKAPGKRPKMDERLSKLLEEDLKERPFVTLRQRCDYVEAISGVSVSRSTMCRAIARIGSTRKKGDESPPSATSS